MSTNDAINASSLIVAASGFTALTERLAQKKNGAELMCSIMNRYLGEMITITSNFSGDVIKFAGDALLVIFRVDRTRTQAGTFPDERVATPYQRRRS